MTFAFLSATDWCGREILPPGPSWKRPKEYIYAHYAEEELSLDDICRELGVSGSYFSSIFKKETGTSFIGFLTECRMEKAARLLLETEEKNYVIADRWAMRTRIISVMCSNGSLACPHPNTERSIRSVKNKLLQFWG